MSSDSTAEPGGSTINRFSRRVSRVLGGSRPHSGVHSRRDSEVAPEVAETAEAAIPVTTETAPTPTRTRFRRSPLSSGRSSGAATPAERTPARHSTAAAQAPSRSRLGSTIEVPAANESGTPAPVEMPASAAPVEPHELSSDAAPTVTAAEAPTPSTHEETEEQSPPNTSGSGTGSVRRSIREYHLLSPITSSSSNPKSP